MLLLSVSVPVQVAPFAIDLLGTSPVLPAVALADGVAVDDAEVLGVGASDPRDPAKASCDPVARAATRTRAPAPIRLSRTRRLRCRSCRP